MGFVSGEYGLIPQEKAWNRMVFEGPPTIFRFDKISNFLGVRAEGSVAAYEGLVFSLSDDGVKMIQGGVDINDIGAEKWDRYLEADIDPTYLYRISSCIDPIRKLYVMGYAPQGAGGSPTKVFCYHWPTGKGAIWSVNHEIVLSGASQVSYTLDTLDDVNPSIDALSYPLDSRIWSGAGRQLLAGFNTSHQLGYFDGATLAATLETGEADLNPGFKTLFKRCRPLIQGSSVSPTVSIGYRNRLNDAVAYTSAVAQNSNGVCNIRKRARYMRARMTTAAADTWDHAIGIGDIESRQMGKK
jgi:hypothetical protein